MKKLIHSIGLLFCILALMGNGLMGFAYAEGNAVEPISNGLSLSWGRNEIRQKFGEPKPGWSSCEMDYGSFAVHKCYGPNSMRVWIHAADITLSSGIGIGSSKTDVASVFGNPYGSNLGPYKLDFKYNGDRVSVIKIDYDATVGSADGQAPASGSKTPASSSSSGLAGMYWCIAPAWSKGTINLLPNGAYEVNGAAAGRYKTGRGQVHFDGSLKSWNNGVAQIDKDGNLIFEWTNSEGWKQYFAYRKGSS